MLGKLKSFKIIGAAAEQPHSFLNMFWNKLMGNYTDTKWNYIGTRWNHTYKYKTYKIEVT